jgi:hypothetical protein
VALEQTEGISEQVARRIYKPKRGEMIGGWRKLLYEELHNLYSPQNIKRMFKSRWERYVARAGKKKRMHGFDGKFRRKEAIRKF